MSKSPQGNITHSKQLADQARKNEQDSKHLKSGLQCKYCKAIYQEKRWRPYADLDPKYVGELHESVCPTCHKKNSHYSDGQITISGKFVKEHKTEIMNLIENIARREEKRDVLNRIERIDEEDENKTVIYTSKNDLARLLGKKLDSAYKGGKLDYNWSKEDKFAEVKWVKEN